MKLITSLKRETSGEVEEGLVEEVEVHLGDLEVALRAEVDQAPPGRPQPGGPPQQEELITIVVGMAMQHMAP